MGSFSGRKPRRSTAPRRNQLMLSAAMSTSLAFAGVVAVPMTGVSVQYAQAQVVKDVSFAKSLSSGVRALTQADGKKTSGSRFKLYTGAAGGLNYQFPSGEYKFAIDGNTYLADGVASVVSNESGEKYAVVELTLRDGKSIPASTSVLEITSDLKGSGGSPVTGHLEMLPSEPRLPLNPTNDPKDPDPLHNEGNKNKCIQEVEGTLTTGTTTWIADSFDAATGKRDANRNRTVLQYRQDGVNDGDHFQPVPGKDPDANLGPGESDWVYNSLAYNSKDGYLYAISQKRPNDDGSHPAGALLRISPQTGAARPLGLISGLNSEDVKTGFTNGAFDFDGDFIFSNNSQFGSGAVYRIPFEKDADSDLAVPTTFDGEKIRATEAFPLSLSEDTAQEYQFQNGPRDESGNILKLHRPWNANDWAFEGLKQNKYIWSVSDDEPWANGQRLLTPDGPLGKGTQRLWRTDTTTGVTDFWDINNLRTPAGDTIDPGIYGNAWTYGNGDLGFSNNNTGTAYRIALKNSEGTRDEVEIALVSKEQVPHSYNNDAATNAYTISELEKAGVDLEVSKELKKVDGKWEWTIEVTNNSP